MLAPLPPSCAHQKGRCIGAQQLVVVVVLEAVVIPVGRAGNQAVGMLKVLLAGVPRLLLLPPHLLEGF